MTVVKATPVMTDLYFVCKRVKTTTVSFVMSHFSACITRTIACSDFSLYYVI